MSEEKREKKNVQLNLPCSSFSFCISAHTVAVYSYLQIPRYIIRKFDPICKYSDI